MKNLGIELRKLHNGEHFQFHTDVMTLITTYGADILEVTAEQASYQQALNAEDAVLILAAKSDKSARIAEQDGLRDDAFLAIVQVSKMMLKFGNANQKQAAERLVFLLDKFPKNLVKRPLKEQTGLMEQLSKDLSPGPQQADIQTLDLGAWVAQMQSANEAVTQLMDERFEESAPRVVGETLQARLYTDEAYYTCINYAVTVGNYKRLPEVYLQFIQALNTRIDYYNNVTHRRAGVNKKKNTNENTPETL